MEAIPLPVQAVLELFASTLAEVRFADVDARALTAIATDVQTMADAVTSAQAALDESRRALEERQQVLLAQAQRAVAYARVFAEGDEALLRQLDAIALPRAVRRPRAADESPFTHASDPTESAAAPRTRGRPRKSPPATLLLAATDGSVALEASAE
jgi:hypothetical protein